MPLSYKELSIPLIEPVSLDHAKHHLRVDYDEDDGYITGLIRAARQRVEKITNRAIFNRQMLLTLDYFPWPGWGSTTGSTAHDYFLHWYYRGLTIRLPLPGTVSVESLTYLANDAVTVVTIDPSKYTVDLTSEPARISPVPGYTWPYQQNYIPGQVRVNYTAGTYELAASAPIVVPSVAPYTVLLPNADKVINFVEALNANGEPVSCTVRDGALTFDPALAGQALTASYTINNCPHTIIWAMYLLIKHWYDHREAASADPLKEIPLGVEDLLAGETFDTFGM